MIMCSGRILRHQGHLVLFHFLSWGVGYYILYIFIDQCMLLLCNISYSNTYVSVSFLGIKYWKERKKEKGERKNRPVIVLNKPTYLDLKRNSGANRGES